MDWCSQNIKLSVTYDLISLGGLFIQIAILAYRRDIFNSYLKIQTEQTALLLQPSTALLDQQPFMTKVIIMYSLLGGLSVSCFIQTLIWLFSTQICYTFGIQNFIQFIVWSSMVGVFTIEKKYIHTITRLKIIFKIIRASRAIYFSQLVICLINLLLLVISDEQSSSDFGIFIYQLMIYILALFVVGAIFMISHLYQGLGGSSETTALQSNKDSFVSLQQNEPKVDEDYKITYDQASFGDQAIRINVGSVDNNHPSPIFEYVPTINNQRYSESIVEGDLLFDVNKSTIFQNDDVKWAEEDVRSKSVFVMPDRHILSVKVDGYKEIKKFGKKTLIYIVHTKFRLEETQVTTQRSYREFRTLHKLIAKAYSQLSHPDFPEKKDKADYLTNKDLKERSEIFDTILQYWVEQNIKNDQLDTFLHPDLEESKSKTSMSSMNSQNSSQQAVEEVFIPPQPATHFDLFLQNQENGVSIKKALQSMIKSEDGEEEQQSQHSDNNLEVIDEFTFKIREIKKKEGVSFYTIESIYNNKVVSKAVRRFKEFKQLHKQLTDENLQICALPDQPPQGWEIEEYRREKLMIYINQIYLNPEVRIQNSFKEFLRI